MRLIAFWIILIPFFIVSQNIGDSQHVYWHAQRHLVQQRIQNKVRN
jgi:hypothetical protein